MAASKGYFDSYGDLEVHSVMLSDNERVVAYKKAIEQNAHMFKGKIILDLGAGTGILSVLCVKAGAAKVYAVEASERMIPVLQTVLEANLVSKKVEIYVGPIEEVILPKQVDVIISEWMGFYLLHEGMLASVLYARDRYLKEDGKMFPSACHLYMAPCELPEMFSKWDSLHGVNLSVFGRRLREDFQVKPFIHYVEPTKLLSAPNKVLSFKTSEVTPEQVNKVDTKGFFITTRDGFYEAVVLWFEVEFPSDVTLTTSPYSPETHWKHTVIVMPRQHKVSENDSIAYHLEITAKEDRKHAITFRCIDPTAVDHPTPCHCNLLSCTITSEYMKEHPSPDTTID